MAATAFQRAMTPGRMLCVFVWINFVNYLDRGLLAGAYDAVDDFIGDSLHTTNEDVYLGALQSSFIAGYAVASVFFGNAVHRFPPFKLMSVGLFIWVVATVLATIAPGYWVLLLARVISGVGEASFQTVVPPWIDDNAPPGKRGAWLAYFFMAITVGTALGNIWGSIISSWWWRMAFLFEVPLMAPFAVMCWFMRYHADDTATASDGKSGKPGAKPSGAGDDVEHGTKPTIWDELKVVVVSPVFMCTVLGYASYAWVTNGVASFGPEIIEGMGLYSSDTQASVTFGLTVAFAGFVGTAAGGLLIDFLIARNAKAKEDNTARASRTVSAVDTPGGGLAVVMDDDLGAGGDSRAASAGRIQSLELELPEYEPSPPPAGDSPEVLDTKLCSATPVSFFGITIGAVLCLIAVGAAEVSNVAEARALFFLLLAIGTVFLFGTTSSVNMAVMASVPQQSRPFALGVSTILMHLLGDVPSPTVIGACLDYFAPKHKDGSPRSAKGVRITLFLLVIWLIWAIGFWFAAWMLALIRRRRRRAAGDKAQPLLHAA